ncbi:MAG: hypothetical protein PHQ46_07950 [Negativicutes bacterium]|nr:hypothetical protein [Negativicutes bacterium]
MFGGMVRDFAVKGAAYFKSDIDLVLLSDDVDHVNSLLKAYPHTFNKFGGWKIKCGLWVLDLWLLRSTWAFSNKLVLGESFADLIRTTFFNWDAAVFELQSKKVHIDGTYFKDIQSGVLDINLEENPNPLGMFLRALKFMFLYDAKITPNLALYLGRILEEDRNDLFDLYSYESGATRWFNKPMLCAFEKQLFEHIEKTPLIMFSPVAHPDRLL